MGEKVDSIASALDGRHIVKTSALRDAGVRHQAIADAIATGRLFLIASGLVATPEAYSDHRLEMATACHRTGGVVANLSAAVWHDLCDATPAQLELIVPWEVTRAPRGLALDLMRSRNARSLTEGVETAIVHGLELRVTDPTRTIVDLYRISPQSNRQHAVAALTTYLRDDRSVDALYRCATAFNTWDALRPEVEAILETLSRGVKP